MPTTRISLDISKLAALPDQQEALKRLIVQHAQRELAGWVNRRLAREVPHRTGRLQRALKFRKLKNGGRFYFTKGGFYYRWQEGLDERLNDALERAFPEVIGIAIRRSLRDLGL